MEKFKIGDRVRKLEGLGEGKTGTIVSGIEFGDGYFWKTDDGKKLWGSESYFEQESTFKPGDKVRSNYSGYVHTLAERMPKHDGFFGTAWGLEGKTSWLGEEQFELVEQTERRPTVGDTVKVTNRGGHCLPLGSIGKIVGVTEKFFEIKVGESAQFLFREQFELVEKQPEQPVGKADVVEYLARISDSEMLDIVEEARTTRGGHA